MWLNERASAAISSPPFSGARAVRSPSPSCSVACCTCSQPTARWPEDDERDERSAHQQHSARHESHRRSDDAEDARERRVVGEHDDASDRRAVHDDGGQLGGRHQTSEFVTEWVAAAAPGTTAEPVSSGAAPEGRPAASVRRRRPTVGPGPRPSGGPPNRPSGGGPPKPPSGGPPRAHQVGRQAVRREGRGIGRPEADRRVRRVVARRTRQAAGLPGRSCRGVVPRSRLSRAISSVASSTSS